MFGSLLLALAVTACNSSSGDRIDAGGGDSGGGDSGGSDGGLSDAGGADLGTGSDLGVVPQDMNVSDDGSVADAGATDLGSVDLGPPPEVAVVACPGSGFTEVVTSYAEGFIPADPNVAVGGIIRFNSGVGAGDIDGDGYEHTVTERTAEGAGEPIPAPEGFDFGVPAGGSICVQFNTAAYYPYYCRIHTSMRGVISVGH